MKTTDKKRKTISFGASMIIIAVALIVATIGVIVILRNVSSEHRANMRTSPTASDQTPSISSITAKLSDAPAKAQPLIVSIATQAYQDCQKAMPGTMAKDMKKNVTVSVDGVAPSTSNPESTPSIVLHAACTKLPPTSYYLAVVGKYWKQVAQATTTAPLSCKIVNQYHLPRQIVDTGQCADSDGAIIDVQ